MNQQSQKRPLVAIVTMFFLFAMIAFVTNLAAPIGTIWKNHYSWAGMLGNMMNFLAYLFMGIPAGNLLTKIGYKKTALLAMVVGIVGLVLQYLSSCIGADTAVFSVDGHAQLCHLSARCIHLRFLRLYAQRCR
jgi:FHS family L-fucose permease-like MFS transporter